MCVDGKHHQSYTVLDVTCVFFMERHEEDGDKSDTVSKERSITKMEK